MARTTPHRRVGAAPPDQASGDLADETCRLPPDLGETGSVLQRAWKDAAGTAANGPGSRAVRRGSCISSLVGAETKPRGLTNPRLSRRELSGACRRDRTSLFLAPRIPGFAQGPFHLPSWVPSSASDRRSGGWGPIFLGPLVFRLSISHLTDGRTCARVVVRTRMRGAGNWAARRGGGCRGALRAATRQPDGHPDRRSAGQPATLEAARDAGMDHHTPGNVAGPPALFAAGKRPQSGHKGIADGIRGPRRAVRLRLCPKVTAPYGTFAPVRSFAFSTRLWLLSRLFI